MRLSEKRHKELPGKDISGHGTKVAAIAAGNNGVASKADIIAVKLGLSRHSSFPRTTNLMEAISYVIKKAIEYDKPIAINISFGNNYGDHMGMSLLERYIDDSALNWKCIYCIGSGNEGLGATHSGGYIKSYEVKEIELGISSYETSINIQIWKEYWDEIEIEVISPRGHSTGKIIPYNSVNRIALEDTLLLVLYGEASPYSVKQEIYIDMIPRDLYITEGIWKIRLSSRKIIGGRYDMWLPSISSLNSGTAFLYPDSSMSCTIPGTSKRAITVGAYDGRNDTMAPFSGRSYVETYNQAKCVKPEIVAPGVDIAVSETNSCTGTSCATPVVTGSAALLMEWGIVKRNDPYLYGEKLKAYMIKGAKQLPGQETPSKASGWGALCVEALFPN